MLDCIVLAGGGQGELARQEGVACKALIELGNKRIIDYVLAVVCTLEAVKRTIVVGPREELLFLEDRFPVEIVAEQENILQNLLAAHRCLDSGRPVLISSADIPFITPEALDDLLARCRPFNYDFYYPISGKLQSERRFPGARRTYVSLQEGTFTGGNVFVVNSAIIESAMPILERFFEYRKTPYKMVSLLGLGFITRLLCKKLTLPALEERFSTLFGFQARAVISDYPELGFDIDKPVDLVMARQMMNIIDTNNCNKGGKL